MRQTVIAAFLFASGVLCGADLTLNLHGVDINANATTAGSVTGGQSNDIDRAAGATVTLNGVTKSVTNHPSFTVETVTPDELNDSVAAAMATNRVTRLWDGSNHWYEVGGRTVTEWWVTTYTNALVLTYSSDFRGVNGERPAITNALVPLPFVDYNDTDLGNGFFLSPNTDGLYLHGPNTEVWYQGQNVISPLNAYLGGAIGQAFLFSETTNSVTRYLSDTDPSALVSAVNGKVDSTNGSATNLDLYSDWQTFSDIAGSFTVTNHAERPVQCGGTGTLSIAFAGLKSPSPIYLELSGFSSVSWPSNAYAVGGWGSWQTNRMNHFAVWMVGTNLFVNQITTTEP